MKDRTDRKTSPLKVTAVILAIIFLVSSGLFAVSLAEKCAREKEDAAPAVPVKSNLVEKNGISYEPDSNIESVLFLGLDKFEGSEASQSYNNDKQADFALLMVFDNAKHEWSAIHLDRDTMVEADVMDITGSSIGTVIEQLTLVHTRGDGGAQSYLNVAKAVERLLKYVKIDRCVTVTMDAVPALNDIVGGVTLEVLDDFTAVDSTLKKGETVALTGNQALTYIRARQGMDDETNKARMERQRQYMNALYEKALECAESDPDFVSNAVTSLLGNKDVSIEHNCGGVDGLQNFAKKLADYKFVEIYALEGDLIVGEQYMEFYPDEEFSDELVLDLFYNKAE